MPVYGDSVNSAGRLGINSKTNLNSSSVKSADENKNDLTNSESTEKKLSSLPTTEESILSHSQSTYEKLRGTDLTMDSWSDTSDMHESRAPTENTTSIDHDGVTLHERTPFRGSCVAIPGSFSYSGDGSGTKYCDYFCESYEDGVQFTMTGPGSGGQCIGAIVQVRPNRSGELSDYAVGYNHFEVSTNDFLDLLTGQSEFDWAAEQAYNYSR